MQEKIKELVLPEAVGTINLLINHYKGLSKSFENRPEMRNREKVEQKIFHLEIAKEALERLEPMKLVDNKCPVCEYDFAGVYAFYCPKCGQGISDFMDLEEGEEIDEG